MEENNKEMEEWKDVKKGQKTSPVVIIILVVLLIAAIGVGFLYGDKLYSLVHKTEENNSKTEEKTEKETTTSEVTIEDAEKILVKFGLSNDSKLPAHYGVYTSVGYTEEFKLANAIANVEESKISKDVCSRLYLGEDTADYITDQGNPFYKVKSNGGVCNPADEVDTVKYDDVNAVYKDLYGTDAPKKAFSLLGGYYKFYDYNTKQDIFVSLRCNGCGGSHGPYAQTIREATLSDNILTIKVAADYIKLEGPSTFSVGGETFTYEGDSLEATVIENHVDKLQQFQITFTKDGDHYTFQNFEKIG